MANLLQNIYTESKVSAFEEILSIYDKKGYAVISYLYFANAMKWKLFEGDIRSEIGDTRSQYIQALEKSDLLLPDGIALEVFYRHFSENGKSLTNLNGTDFLPFFLHDLNTQGVKAEIILYGTKEEHIELVEDHYESYFPVIYAQHGYKDFDWNSIPKKEEGVVRLMLVGRGSPLQEIWSIEHVEHIKQHNCLVMNQGGTFEFAIGAEKRAPERMIQARVLETFWRIATNPKKNLRKFLDMFGVVGFLWRKYTS